MWLAGRRPPLRRNSLGGLLSTALAGLWKMLYIVGGVARSGKSIIARQMLAEAGVPYFSLDFLMMGLARGIPEAKVDPEAPSHEVAIRMWPVVRALSVNILETGVDYLIEGDSVLPAHIQELAAAFPNQLRPCFIGYPTAEPLPKIEAIRSHSALPNDWLSAYPPEQILEFIKSMITFSRSLQEQCQENCIPFFDVSERFNEGAQAAVRYLKTGLIEA